MNKKNKTDVGRGEEKAEGDGLHEKTESGLEEYETRQTGEEKTVHLCISWSGGLRHDRDHKANTPWSTSTQTMYELCQDFANNMILVLAHLCPL